MFENYQWWLFLVAITVLTLSPGVDTLLVVRSTARGGWRDGVQTSIGISSGLFFHATVSAAGLSLILLGSAQMFLVMKLAGALYLTWLGMRGFYSALRGHGVAMERGRQSPVSAIRSLREGVLSNLLNLKTLVFYMAFLTQFIDPAFSLLLQAGMMASVHFLLGMIWLSLVSLGVVRAKMLFVRRQTARIIDSIAGALLVFIGARMAVQ